VGIFELWAELANELFSLVAAGLYADNVRSHEHVDELTLSPLFYVHGVSRLRKMLKILGKRVDGGRHPDAGCRSNLSAGREARLEKNPGAGP